MQSGARIDGRFVIDCRIGAGGMGTVYRARDERTNELVAVKIVREPSPRFDREADLLARLEHPGIVRHIAHGRTDAGEQFLVMEWLEGEDLQRRLARGPLSAGEALVLARAVARPLVEVHARGIVHRDVKPSNIWLVDGRVDRPMLLDFGIARPLEARALTATGSAVGTPQYMAPEQVQSARDVDARADIYALGTVVFECVAGRPPFIGDNAIAVLAKVLIENAPSLRDFNADVSDELADLVGRTLAKRREDRPADTRSLLAELERVPLAGGTGGTAVRAPAVPPRIGALERRLACVVLAGGAESGARTATPEQLSVELDRVRSIASAHRTQLVALGRGYLAATYSGGGVPTDHARGAARYALALAAELPSLVVVLAMGWGTVEPVPAGEAIDRAAALLRAGRPADGGVRIDEVAASLLEVGCELGCDDAGQVLRGERRAGERPRTLLGLPTPCVGRDRELRALEELFDEVRDDRVSRAALVTAPAGGGKSRLRHELLERLARRAAPPAIVIAHAEMLRAGSPLDLLARCVRALTGVEDGQPAEIVQAQIRARVGNGAELAEFLCEIVRAPVVAGVSPRLDAARNDARTMGDQMLRAWLALLTAQCAEGPCVLVLEDLHWGDPQTVRFVDVALRELATAPLFVLALARAEVHDRFPGLWRDRALQEIRLGGLPVRACQRLVREVLPDIDDAAVERIALHAEGNAFFLEEMIRAWAAGGLAALPTSVIAMVQTRIEALDVETRRVSRVASVFGESCRPAGIAVVLGDPRSLDDALARLVAAEIMSHRVGDGGVEYMFRHALVREAAYAGLTEEDRRVAHGVAARWLESVDERDALLLAGHFEAAGDRAEAARCWADAAHQALEKNDFDAGLTRARHALELEPTDAARRRALSALGRTSACLGRWVDAQRDTEAALALTAEPAPRIELLRDMFRVAVFRQDATLARTTGNEALAIAGELRRPELAAEAEAALALADHCEARGDLAVGRYLGACEASGRTSLMVGLSGILLYHHARFDDAVRWNEQHLRNAIEARDWQTISVAHANVALAQTGRGAYGIAEEHFVKARETAERCGLTTMLARAVSVSAGWQGDVYDYDGALRAAEEARYIGRDLEFSTPRVSAMIDLATIAVRRDRPDDAERSLDSIGEAVANGTGFHGWLWRLRDGVLRAEIAAARKAWPHAIELARTAAERCDAHHRHKYAIAARVVLARALAAADRGDDAVDVLSRARGDAERWGDPTWRLRVALAALACGDRTALAAASALAGAIESALPAPRAAIFRASAELRQLG